MFLPDAHIHVRATAVALPLLQYTPQVTDGEEATLLLDVGASLRLFGGVRALATRHR